MFILRGTFAMEGHIFVAIFVLFCGEFQLSVSQEVQLLGPANLESKCQSIKLIFSDDLFPPHFFLDFFLYDNIVHHVCEIYIIVYSETWIEVLRIYFCACISS